MTRSEFLNKLKEALANDLSGPVIQENVNYYSGYIADEVRKEEARKKSLRNWEIHGQLPARS